MSTNRFIGPFIFVSVLAAVLLLVQAANAATSLDSAQYSDWTLAKSIGAFGSSPDLNTEFLEGCPILSRDSLQLYFASNRPGGLGGLDIWVAERSSPVEPFGDPVNLGVPINSAYNDFCPSPLRDGHRFLFVSNRPGYCGNSPNGDIYLTRYDPENRWQDPVNLGCEVNSAGDEAGPVLSFAESGPPTLYFSRSIPGQPGSSDIYRSEMTDDWTFGPAEQVPGVNSVYDDMQPSVRRDGLEMVFASNRPGSLGMDIWSASRDMIAEEWTEVVNLGTNVNSAANESRPSLSWDGKMLLFGSTRPGEGMSDIYYSTRDR